MRKMSFRATGSDTALQTCIRGKVKRNTDGAWRRRASVHFVRIIVGDVFLASPPCVFVSVSLSYTPCIYLTRSLATFLRRDRKSRREGRRIRKRSERIGGESGPSIKTLKITEFLLVFLGALRKPGCPGTGYELALLEICQGRKSEFSDINSPFLLRGMLWLTPRSCAAFAKEFLTHLDDPPRLGNQYGYLKLTNLYNHINDIFIHAVKHVQRNLYI